MTRWYPSTAQLDTPEKMERALRQVLKQHYDLQDRFDELHSKMNGATSAASVGGGAIGTKIAGIPVAPIDTNTLANGTKLTYVKAQGILKFL